MQVEELAASGLDRIGEIDRSERASGFFVLEDRQLRRVERDLSIASWNEQELAETTDRLRRGLAEGGVLLGVVDGPSLVAAALLGGARLAGPAHRLELVFLHVSRTHRRRGLARMLLDEVCRRARAQGAAQLYVSSSDVEPAVRFYLGSGFVLAEPVDAEIAARWPEDIPLELELG